MKDTPSIYSSQFILLCASSFLFSASFNMLIPELPAYLSKMGGAEYKGLIIALFTLTAGISRPFSGKLTDSIGRIPIMAVGSIVCFVCGFLYPVLATVSGFLFLRLIHGFSTGFKPTATAAYVADVIPQNRWGEAMGIHGLCFSTGLAIGPAIGSAITAYYSINVLFYCSSVFALFSILILMNMKETLARKQKFSFKLLKISRGDIFDMRVFPSALVTFLSYISYGAMLTLIPDWGDHLGVKNKGLFYMVFTLATLLVRFLSRKVSDKYGRIKVLKVSLVMLSISLCLIGYADSIMAFLVASAVYGASTGLLSPAVSAWTSDLSHPEHRGKAMATMYISLEAGIGLGALLAGFMFTNNIAMIAITFYITAGISLIALFYLLTIYKKKET